MRLRYMQRPKSAPATTIPPITPPAITPPPDPPSACFPVCVEAPDEIGSAAPGSRTVGVDTASIVTPSCAESAAGDESRSFCSALAASLAVGIRSEAEASTLAGLTTTLAAAAAGKSDSSRRSNPGRSKEVTSPATVNVTATVQRVGVGGSGGGVNDVPGSGEGEGGGDGEREGGGKGGGGVGGGVGGPITDVVTPKSEAEAPVLLSPVASAAGSDA